MFDPGRIFQIQFENLIDLKSSLIPPDQNSTHGDFEDRWRSFILLQFSPGPDRTADDPLFVTRRYLRGSKEVVTPAGIKACIEESEIQKLVCAHIPAVKRIARGYAGYGLPHEDLVQEGCLGLISATRRFDQSLGVPLLAYADCWIRASMQEYILRNWCIVKIATTKSRRKLFYRLRSAKPRLEWMSQSEVKTIAAALDVSEDDVSEMERALYGRDVAFDLSSDKESNTLPPSAYLEHCCDGPDAQVMQQESSNEEFRLLSKAIGRLDDRSREIVEQRWLQEGKCRPTLDTLAHQFAISAERVRQIEAEALRRLRSEFRSYLATRA